MDDMSKISCLLVDDDAFMLISLRKILESLGVTSITSTNDAKDALKYLSNRNNRIDVVISDLNMPNMDGIQLLRHLGMQSLNLSIILVSGEDPRLLDSAKTLAQQQNLDILGSINKPVTKDKIQAMLRSYKPSVQSTPEGPGAMVFADELQTAIINDEISVHFQPQVNVKDGRIVGAEALARWKHPQKSWIPPGIFIGIAEKHKMIQPITDFVFQESVSETARLRKLGLNFTISINFSAQVLSSLELPEILCETLANSGLQPSNVIIEVTESSLADDMNVTLDILTRMRLKGFGLSIDDFGTGFSSMEQLHKIPFTELKIDRSFVHQANQNQASRAILESSIALAKNLKINCVAEGVETQEDWDLVAELGCDIVQGYFVARPQKPSDFLAWSTKYIAEQKRR
jgi:EAL domain-containing protein (putative c-di-GMP-specific phosphodiesterase class I)/CheY-like chemotaxis protein